jgi:hypothetical protein
VSQPLATLCIVTDSELERWVLAAAKACQAAALAAIHGGAWIPRDSLPEIGEFQGGWPSFQKSVVGGATSAPSPIRLRFAAESHAVVATAFAIA